MGFSAQLGGAAGLCCLEGAKQNLLSLLTQKNPALGTVVTARISEGTHFIVLYCVCFISLLFYFLILEKCPSYTSFQEQVQCHAQTVGILKGRNMFWYLSYPEASIQEANSLGMLNGNFIKLGSFYCNSKLPS